MGGAGPSDRPSPGHRRPRSHRWRWPLALPPGHGATAREGARGRSRPCRLACPGALRDRVTAELTEGRSPEAIHLDLAAEAGDTLAVETIYLAVYAGVLEVKATDCLRMRRPRRRCRQGGRASRRPVSSNIAARPASVGERSEPGHCEGDHIIAKANGSAMLCLTERVTRFSILVTMPEGYDSTAALAGLAALPSSRSLSTCESRSRSTKDPSGPSGRPWPPPTASTSGSATRTRRENAARSRTSTASGAGGSHAAPNSPTSPQPPPTTPPPSSTANADAPSPTHSPATLYAALTVQ